MSKTRFRRGGWSNIGLGRDEQPVSVNIANATFNTDLSEASQDYIRGEEAGEVTDVKLVALFGENLLKRLFVIAERTENGVQGRMRRELNSQFSEAERNLLSKWRLRIRAWYLLTGVPRNGVRMAPSTYGTLCKFADFFASI
jgi:hypothetical protein